MGKLTILVGPMYSKKTTNLLLYLEDYEMAKKNCTVIKYKKDKRYAKAETENIISHNKTIRPVNFSVDKLSDIPAMSLVTTDVILIDEGQFFTDIVEFCDQWASLGKDVVVAALSGTFEREPFSNMTRLYSKADKVISLHAVCSICFEKACFTKRLSTSNEQVLIGGTELYAARCRKCFKL